TALGIDALSSAESWSGPRSREGGGGGFARVSAGDLTPPVSGGGDVSGSEGLLALLAEGGPAMAELVEKACGLALALGRVGAASAGEAAAPGGDVSSAASASMAAECTAGKEDLVTAGGASAGLRAVQDDGGEIHGGGDSTVAEASLPNAAASGGGGEGGVSPLLQKQLAAFCRQALEGAGQDPAAAAAAGNAAVTSVTAAGGADDVATSWIPLVPADLATRVERLACCQFGAERFEDLVTHGSMAQLLAGDRSAAVAAAAQQPLFVMALLAGSETSGTGEDDVASYSGQEDILMHAMSLAATAASNGVSAAAILSYFSAAAALAAGGAGGGGESPVWAAAAALGGPVAALALPVGAMGGGVGPGALVLVDPAATTNRFGEALSRLDGSAAVAALLGLTAGA
ncbi:hypothetical protein Vretimale_17498, partial [Volvox reticuliferus]